MTRFVLRRLAQVPIIVLVVYTVTFVLAWALPGSAVMGDDAREPEPEVLAAMERSYNLHNPLAFYTGYLHKATGTHWAISTISGKNTHGPVFDLGPSMRHQDWTVNEILATSLPVSISLGLVALAIALAIGLACGVAGAVRPNSWLDAATLGVAMIGISLPSFLVGAVILLVFPVWLGVGRVGGWGQPGDVFLPALTLSLPYAAYIARLTRMGMLDALGADYVRTARAKGASEWNVVWKHALKNAALPVLSFLGPAAASIMTGSFVVEMVFNIPGVGQHFVNGVLSKDLFLIMGVVLAYATLLTVMNLLVDVAYRWVDPRIDLA